MGGGGANSLNSPDSAPNSDFDGDKNENTWTEPTYKTFEDYFIDYFNWPSEMYSVDQTTGKKTLNYVGIYRKTTADGVNICYNSTVFTTITHEDFSGSGTLSDPYIIGSVKGLWYFMNPNLSQISFVGQYIKLGCDIVMNDETFDANGNPRGGDGIVYSWTYFHHGKLENLYFDGDNHFISGLYHRNENGQFMSLFGGLHLTEIKNLTMTNYFILGDRYVATFTYNSIVIDNCVAQNGYLYSTLGSVGGIAVNGTKITNSKNYSYIYSGKDIAGGITASHSASSNTMLIENCVNYGEVRVANAFAGGISGVPQRLSVIKNCVNYGAVTGKTFLGGICCANHRDYGKDISYCENYGDIYCSGSGVYVGGILGWSNITASISHCKSFGNIANATNGTIYFGAFIGAVTDGGNVTVSDCEVDAIQSQRVSLFGIVSNSTLNVTNIKAKIKGENQFIGVFGYLGNADCTLKNIECILETTASTRYCYFVQDYRGTNNISIDTMIVQTNASNFRQKQQLQGQSVKSFIMNNVYFGSDVSGFNLDWKTGKLGFGRNKNNMFQRKVTEQWLQNQGYTKYEI